MDLKLSMLSWLLMSWKPFGRGLARSSLICFGSIRKKCRHNRLVRLCLDPLLASVSCVKLALLSYRETTISDAVLSMCGMAILGLLVQVLVNWPR